MEDGKPVAIGGRALDVLSVLIRRAGTIVSKQQLLSDVWPGVFVAEGTLRVHVAELRKALGDGTGERRFIINAAGRGYSFVATCTHLETDEPFSLVTSPEPASPARPSPVPTLLTKVFGRDDMIARLVARLPLERSITIVGIGGIGKTTLALSVLEVLSPRYADGVCFVDLAPVSDPALVPSALAAALRLPVGSNEPIPALVNALSQRRMLILLDNCEHVVEVAATLAEAIARGAAGVHILATSRIPLRSRGERIQRLTPLETPPASPVLGRDEALQYSAVQLFVDRASAAVDEFQVSDENAWAIGEICRKLDGIALAIEMAASRVEAFGVLGVEAHLNDRFALLKQGHRTSIPHHQTLNATFDWSWHLLSERSRRVFRRLSTLAGEFSIETAAAIAASENLGDDEVLHEIANLVSASLLSANVSRDQAIYRFLDSTRAYARSKLLESGELNDVSGRHAAYILAVLKQADAKSDPSTIESALDGAGLLDDLRLALDWAFSRSEARQLGIRLTVEGVRIWTQLSLHEECRTRVEVAIKAMDEIPDLDSDSAMRLFAALGTVLAYTRSTEARKAWEKVLEISEQIPDTDYQLRALRGLWTASFSAGQLSSAVQLNKRHFKVTKLSGNPEEKFHCIRMRGMCRFYVGKFERASVDLERALSGYLSCTKLDLKNFQFDQRALLCVGLSKTLWIRGFPDQATAIADRALTYASDSKHDLSVIYALAYASCRMAILNGDMVKAAGYLDALVQKSFLYPLKLWDIMGECWRGVLLARQGNVREATRVLSKALADVPEGSFSLHYSRFMGEYALALGQTGEAEKALDAIDKAITVSDRLGERWFFAELLRLKGEIILIAGRPGALMSAEVLFHASIELARRQGALSWELRAATSLSQLHSSQGRTAEGRDILYAVYSRFSEGFQTIDLMRAMSVLELSLNKTQLKV